MKREVSKHIGKKIRYFRTKNKMTQKELGEKVGVKHNTISSYEKGTNDVEHDILFKMAEILNVSINDFFPSINNKEEKDESEYMYFPATVSAGLPINIDGITENEVKKITVPNSIMGKWAGDKEIFMMRVNGDSMNNILSHGTLIAVKNVDISSLKDGDIVVYSDNYEYSVKRFYVDQEGEKFIFRPDSNDKRFVDYVVPFSMSHNLKIHGKVVLYVVELS